MLRHCSFIKFDRWVIQAAEATITDEDMELLLRMCLHGGAIRDMDGPLQHRRLVAAINSYCHIVRITREYHDADVSVDASQRLLAKQERYQPFTARDIRLLGKRSSSSEANTNLWTACVVVGPTLSEEQCSILVESLFEQAVVHATGAITDRAWFATPRMSPELTRKLDIIVGISLLTEACHFELQYSKLSPEEKADCDRFSERLRRAICGLPDDRQD
jgi:hypothetical protein